ncbi:MAG: peptidase M32 [candidate division Zixibacteria bacterium SM23_73_3]|nr:MAG: peptidase M32 [candidate division Zixibacteria bacterium SM23_73_3]
MTDDSKKAYERLLNLSKEIHLLDSSMSVLDWDQKTYIPKEGVRNRGNQLALLAGISHQRSTSPEIGDLLKQLEGSSLESGPDSFEAANIREIKHSYEKLVKIPKSLVEELTRITTVAHEVWAEARKKSDFSIFLPYLEKIIKLKHQQAEAVGYEKHPYDALLDDFEPGATIEKVAKVFADFRQELVDLVKAISHSGKRPDTAILERDYPVDRQNRFGREAASAIGYDFEKGRLDVTVHPFCTGIGPGDVRITTRYNPNHFGQAFFGILHEAGHGIYEQGLDPERYGTPGGDAVSLGIHESQSRMWENLVGRSKPFWKYFFPKAQKVYPKALGDVKFEDFYFAINEAKLSFIRVEADEVTYNLHILVRFEIEQAFFSGDLSPKDIPGAWNEKFKNYFGLVPPDDAQGCLQDVHWSSGYFGYFPTYSLGNLYSAQFFDQAKKELGDLDQQFAKGEFGKLKEWLQEKIHRQGQRYRAEKLVEVVTGKPLSHRPLMDYLKAKYGELYAI